MTDGSSRTSTGAPALTAAGRGSILACALVCAIGYSSFSALPVLLGLFAGLRGIDAAALGWIGSAEMAGLLLGSLAAARAIRRLSGHQLILGGLALAILANAATIVAKDASQIALCRLLAGAGGGLCYAVTTARLATAGDATRNFALFIVASVIQSALLLAGMPWLAGIAGLGGAIGLLLGWLLLAVPLSFLLPPPPAVTVAEVDHGDATVPADARALRAGRAWLGAAVLTGIVLTAAWSFVERIGAASGLSIAQIGTALNIGNFACLAPAFLATTLVRFLPIRYVQVATLIGLAVLLLQWPVGGETMTAFSVRAILLFMGISLVQIYLLSVFGDTDPTGRQATLAPAALGVGQAIGPVLASTAFGFADFGGALALDAALLLAVAAICHWGYGELAAARRRALQPLTPQPAGAAGPRRRDVTPSTADGPAPTS